MALHAYPVAPSPGAVFGSTPRSPSATSNVASQRMTGFQGTGGSGFQNVGSGADIYTGVQATPFTSPQISSAASGMVGQSSAVPTGFPSALQQQINSREMDTGSRLSNEFVRGFTPQNAQLGMGRLNEQLRQYDAMSRIAAALSRQTGTNESFQRSLDTQWSTGALARLLNM